MTRTPAWHAAFVSKSAYRVRSAQQAFGVLTGPRRCVERAHGPVSVEVPIDLQREKIDARQCRQFCLAAAGGAHSE